MPATTTISGPAEALSRLASARDAEAWGWLLERLGPEIRGITERLSEDAAGADDAVQEALLTIRDHAGSFRPRLDPDADARRWIFRVASNAALRARRSRRRERIHDTRAGASSEREEPRAGTAVERDETAGIVRTALASLGEAERSAIVLHVVAGLGYDQVAAELRCPVGTAKTRVHRGLERLRRRLGPRAQALSIAAIVGLLQQRAGSAETLSSTASGLLHAPASAATSAIPASIGGLTMVTKAGLALVVVAAVATPVALLAQERAVETPPSATAAAATPAPVIDVAALLEQELEHVEFQNASLGSVAQFIQRKTGIQTRVDKDLIANERTSVTLTADRQKLRYLLDLVNRETGTQWVIEGQSLRIERDVLATLLTVSYVDVSVGIVAADLSKKTGCAINVDPTLVAVGPVRIAAEGIPLYAFLSQICESISAHWIKHEGSLVIVPGLALEPDGSMPLALAPGPIQDHLKQRITTDFADRDLENVVDCLRQVTGVTIILAPDLTASPPEHITLRSENLPFGDLLGDIATQAHLSLISRGQEIYVQRGVIFDLTQAPPLPRERR